MEIINEIGHFFLTAIYVACAVIISIGLTNMWRYGLGFHKGKKHKAIFWRLREWSDGKWFSKPFGFCPACNNFWVSIIVSVAALTHIYVLINEFWCVVFTLLTITISHRLIKKEEMISTKLSKPQSNQLLEKFGISISELNKGIKTELNKLKATFDINKTECVLIFRDKKQVKGKLSVFYSSPDLYKLSHITKPTMNAKVKAKTLVAAQAVQAIPKVDAAERVTEEMEAEIKTDAVEVPARKYSDAVVQYAKVKDVDLSEVTGTGKKGNVLIGDVNNYIAEQKKPKKLD